MPVVLSDLMKTTAPMDIPIGQEVIHCQVAIMSLTRTVLESAEDYASFVVSAIKSWDLETEPGVVMPLDEETIAKIPLVILTRIAKHITKELNDTGESEGGSFGA